MIQPVPREQLITYPFLRWLEEVRRHINEVLYLRKVTSVTADYTVLSGDHTILCDSTSGAITISLPAAADSFDSTLSSGRIITFVKTAGASVVTLDGSGAETIDGSLTATVSTSMVIQSDGTSWYTIG